MVTWLVEDVLETGGEMRTIWGGFGDEVVLSTPDTLTSAECRLDQ